MGYHWKNIKYVLHIQVKATMNVRTSTINLIAIEHCPFVILLNN